MELLFDRQGDQVTITEDVVKAAARNRRHGSKVMSTPPLPTWRPDYHHREDVVKAAAGNGSEVLTILLDRYGDQLTITEDVVNAAAGNEESVVARWWRSSIRYERESVETAIAIRLYLIASASGQLDVLDVSEETYQGKSCYRRQNLSIAKFYNAAKTGDVEIHQTVS